ncbi:hypothetical protein E2320_007496, partial [Naja naja]
MRCGRNSRSTFHPGQANTKIYDINILAHFWTIKAFLPAMMKNNHGHIVSIVSAGG